MYLGRYKWLNHSGCHGSSEHGALVCANAIRRLPKLQQNRLSPVSRQPARREEMGDKEIRTKEADWTTAILSPGSVGDHGEELDSAGEPVKLEHDATEDAGEEE
jgi:hypothetical protein